MKKVLSTPDLTREAKLQAFDRLLTIMDELRENCPWDKKQTLESLRHLTIEETYELSDSILEGNLSEIKKELGDILLHMVFYARIASELKAFDITEVLNSICDKLVEQLHRDSIRFWVRHDDGDRFSQSNILQNASQNSGDGRGYCGAHAGKLDFT